HFSTCFFFSSRRRHTRFSRDWSSDVCSSDLATTPPGSCERQGQTVIPGLATSTPNHRSYEEGNGWSARHDRLVHRGTHPELGERSEERRVGKEGGSRGSVRH